MSWRDGAPRTKVLWDDVIWIQEILFHNKIAFLGVSAVVKIH